MDIQKGTCHQKIIGDFGEGVLLNWLSRSGFEVCLVDHTGLDVIAYHPVTKKRLGISVKSRIRDLGKENNSVNLLSYQRGEGRPTKTSGRVQGFCLRAISRGIRRDQ